MSRLETLVQSSSIAMSSGWVMRNVSIFIGIPLMNASRTLRFSVFTAILPPAAGRA